MLSLAIIIPLAINKKVEGLHEIRKQTIDFIPIYGNNTSQNRNIGVKKATTKYVAFINGHTILSHDWLNNIELFFQKYPEVDIVGGPQLTRDEDPFFGRTSGIALSSFFGTASLRNRYMQGKENLNANENMLTSANLICKKSVFHQISYDENLYPGEDLKFIIDAKKANFIIAYSPKIVTYNKRRSNLWALAKQIFNYGQTRLKAVKFRTTLKNPVIILPSLFILYTLVLPFVYKNNIWASIPFLTYVTLLLFFSFYETLKRKRLKSFFLLICVFLGIHVSYGLGFIFGTIKSCLCLARNKKNNGIK